jgi:adenosylcobyric acid synthase
VVCEGAGSPAETNLLDTDLSNMRVAEYTAAPVILIGDIDRGGVFAHLFGTWSLVGDRHRDRIAGFVLNKFRGDPSLLAPAPRDLEALTGVPVLGVVPMLRHHVPDEDGADPDRGRGAGDGPVVAVVRGPFASNLDEFSLLGQVCRLRWAQRPADLDGAELVVIPGSKHTMADRDWMRERGLDRAVVEAWRRGERIVGVCGGLQILGGELSDPYGIETAGRGLGLLPVSTVLDRHKRVDPIRTSFAAMPLPWQALSGLSIEGYQIRHGVSTAAAPLHEALPHGLGWVEANLLAVYVHGMFEMQSVLRALVGRAPTRTLDDELDTVADALEAHVDLSSVDRLLGW